MIEDIHQSDAWAKYLQKINWKVEKISQGEEHIKVYIRKVPLFGSVIKIQRPNTTPSVEKINDISQKNRALFVKIEPNINFKGETIGEGFTKDKWPLLPTKTIWVDLRPPLEKIHERFSQDAHYSIKRAERNGVGVEILPPNDENILIFHSLFKETGRRKNFWVPPLADLKEKIAAFENSSLLALAKYSNKPVAGALILFHQNTGYYHHAASNMEGRKLLAPYLIVDKIVKAAKGRSCNTLDLEGIHDDQYKAFRRFKSITVFKRKFGGEEITYPGSYTHYYNQAVQKLFFVTEKF